MKRLALVLLVTALAAPFARPTAVVGKVLLPWEGTCPCEWRAPGVFWQGKADFVRCAVAATRAAVVAGEITLPEAKSSIRVARRSVPCGRRSFARRATCGGPETRACPARDDVCSYIDPACAASRWGYCVNRACSSFGDAEPVCGCDGRTYDGHCAAFDAGIEVAHFGSCAAGPATR